MPLKITVDGPAGSGKSATARELAKKIQGIYIDSGAMFRSVTLMAIEKSIIVSDSEKIGKMSGEILIQFKDSKSGQKTIVNGMDRTFDIRKPEVEAAVSIVAANKTVRENMLKLQRKMAEGWQNVVLEGRDAGSAVLPEADFKFFLTADPAVRALRRHAQSGKKVDPKIIEEEMKKRDHLDSTRKESPLVIPDGSKVIDNSKLSLDETVQKIIDYIA